MIETHLAAPIKISASPMFELTCPHETCRGAVVAEGDAAQCESCGRSFSRRAGIWRFLPTPRESAFAEFLRDYQIVRRDEGWGAPHADYYRALPYVAHDDPQRQTWRIRAENFQSLLALIGDKAPLRILDAGAGNGWLSNQLAWYGHTVAALDVSDDPCDGLGAWVNYTTHFECYQAEFDRLPFRHAQFDLVIFNAALHYSFDLGVTLREAHRMTTPNGKTIVLDSPCYSNAISGAAMIAEREAGFARKFGFKRQVYAVGFLTEAKLGRAAADAGLAVNVGAMDDNWIKKLQRSWAKWRMGREPARFPLIVLEKM